MLHCILCVWVSFILLIVFFIFILLWFHVCLHLLLFYFAEVCLFAALYKLWNRLVCYYVSFAASCKHVQCPVGQHCLEDQNLMPHCVTCSITCPPYDAAVKSVISNPARLVCGVDGNTYRNLCEIKRTACMLGRSIPVAYRGTCRGKKEFCLRLTLYLFEGSI